MEERELREREMLAKCSRLQLCQLPVGGAALTCAAADASSRVLSAPSTIMSLYGSRSIGDAAAF